MTKATIAIAKAAYDANPKISVRNLANLLKGQGHKVSASTIQRWKDHGWVSGEEHRRSRAEAEAAARLAGAGIEAQEKKIATRLEVIQAEEAAMKTRRAELMEEKAFPLHRLRDIKERETLIAQILLAEQVSRRAAVLVEVQGEVAADILKVLSDANSTTTLVIPPQPEAPSNGENARVIDGRAVSPTALAIDAFKVRQRQGVAA